MPKSYAIPVVAAIILREKELLLKKDTLLSPGDLWAPPCSTLFSGEDPEWKIRRYLLLEMKILTTVGDLIQVRTGGDRANYLVLYYRCKIVRGLKFLNTQNISWVPLEKLDSYVPPAGIRNIFTQLLRV